MRKRSKTRMGQRAQTATELAVFGAVLLFVIGAIVRQALHFSQIQNQNLRAFRMAMRLSYEHSMGLRPSTKQNGVIVGNVSRNFASVLLIEDRLSADSAKFGSLNRSPVIANAQGAHTRNFYMPVDVSDPYSEPMSDMFINGKHFPLTTARYKTICMTESDADCPTALNPNGPGMRVVWIGDPDGPGGNPPRNPNEYWLPDCVTRYPPPPALPYSVGCPKFYTLSPNNPENIGWWSPSIGNGYPCGAPCNAACTDIYSSCPGKCPGVGGACAQNYTPQPMPDRFDLDHSGGSDVLGGIQDDFNWQWVLVAGFDRDHQLKNKTPTRLNYGEFLSFGTEKGSEQKNTVLDVDNDLKEERVIRNSLKHNGDGVILELVVFDSQDGDTDYSYDTLDYKNYIAGKPGSKPEPGLMEGIAMYTRVRPGTYLEIKEGNVVSPAGQKVRSVQRKDHIDIIQRMIRMSNDTGRFCDTPTTVNPDTAVWDDVPNPVEACGPNCFTAANTSLTCFDTDDKIIFIRSRVSDQFGHQWITDTSSDDYVNFLVPPP